MATVIFPQTPTTTRTSRFATSRHHSCGSPSPPILFLNHRAISLPSIRRSRLFHPPSAVSCERSDNGNLWRVEDDELGFTDKWKTKIELLKSVLPGGSWWRLEDVVGTVGEGGGKDRGRDVTLAFALKRMWELVGHDRWIVFCGFAALVFAVMSDMSIPNFLAASIFSAQNGNAVQFHRNAQLLVFLCFSSGICRLISFPLRFTISKVNLRKQKCCLQLQTKTLSFLQGRFRRLLDDFGAELYQ